MAQQNRASFDRDRRILVGGDATWRTRESARPTAGRRHLAEHGQGAGLGIDCALAHGVIDLGRQSLSLASSMVSRIGCSDAGVAVPCAICIWTAIASSVT